jgi:hypothetical protein
MDGLEGPAGVGSAPATLELDRRLDGVAMTAATAVEVAISSPGHHLVRTAVAAARRPGDPCLPVDACSGRVLRARSGMREPGVSARVVTP